MFGGTEVDFFLSQQCRKVLAALLIFALCWSKDLSWIEEMTELGGRGDHVAFSLSQHNESDIDEDGTTAIASGQRGDGLRGEREHHKTRKKEHVLVCRRPE